MMARQFEHTFFDWNYNLYASYVRFIGWIAIACQVLLYFLLQSLDPTAEGVVAHLAVSFFYVPLIVFPLRDWHVGHQLYFELILAANIPFYFSYLLLGDTSPYWAVTFLAGIVAYAFFSCWQIAVLLYPLAVSAAFGLVHFLHPVQNNVYHELFYIQLVAFLAFTVVQIVKNMLTTSHEAMVHLKEKADQQNEIFSALFDISVEVSRVDDLDEIFHLLLKRFETIFPHRGFGLMVEGPREKVIAHMAFRGISEKDTSYLLREHSQLLGYQQVSKGKEGETISKVAGTSLQVFGGGIHSTSAQGMAGYCLKLFIKGRRLAEDECRTLEVFLETIRGITWSRIQALELERFSNTDRLTGIFNRNYFDRIFDEWCRKARAETPFSLVFGDINGLKRVNDTYGHKAGDLLIRTAADLLVKNVRSSDLVFRLGGDEIVILCPNAARQDADRLVARIKEVLVKATIDCVDERTGDTSREQVRISFGVACSTERRPEELLALADFRMFQAKEAWYAEKGMERYRQ